jgi:thiol-disulfide isomerase/thioredoxin
LKQDIIHGAQILKRMIYQNTSGFTRDLALTDFYLRVIGGQQLEEFEALYDSSFITDPYLRGVIKYEYRNLKKYLNNQQKNGANLRSINSSIVKNLVNTILAKYSGKVIYIDFWAPWCVPCMYEMPYSKELQNVYQNKEVVFLFLASRCNDSWKATIANQKLTGEHILLRDDQFTILSAEFGIKGIPHYVLIDKKGNIVFKNAARPSQMDLLRKQIDKLL